MRDQQLTERAALAGGVSGEWIEHPTEGWGFFQLTGGGHWSPLANDGDALRLAVKLGMHCVGTFPVPSLALINECGGDEYAATRRAIVRAAAEIGRN